MSSNNDVSNFDEYNKGDCEAIKVLINTKKNFALDPNALKGINSE